LVLPCSPPLSLLPLLSTLPTPTSTAMRTPTPTSPGKSTLRLSLNTIVAALILFL
jgi:hypothetical protein